MTQKLLRGHPRSFKIKFKWKLKLVVIFTKRKVKTLRNNPNTVYKLNYFSTFKWKKGNFQLTCKILFFVTLFSFAGLLVGVVLAVLDPVAHVLLGDAFPVLDALEGSVVAGAGNDHLREPVLGAGKWRQGAHYNSHSG